MRVGVMGLSRKIRDVVLCAALLGIPLAFLQANLKSPHELNFVDKLLLRASAPLQSAVTAAAEAVHHGWRRYVYLVDLRQENDHLLERNRELERELRSARRKLLRLDHYQKLLQFRATRGVETIGARVVGRTGAPLNANLRLRVDRGEEAVRSGLPVMVADGVVGRIGRVYGSYSELVLAVDARSSIDVVLQRTGARGMLRGVGGRKRYHCKLDYLLRDKEVKVGDLVVTSGAAGVFPKDIPVGRVSRVTRRTYGLYQEVEVTPTVDFAGLREVLIILAPPPPDAPRHDEKERAAVGLAP